MPLNFNGISSAMFDTPKDYETSREYYKQTLQDKVDDTFEFSSDTYKIGFENSPGTLEFSDILCRVNHAIEPKTGLNLGDDFKELKFFNLSSFRKMGERYNFSDSIWITTNTDNYKNVTQSAIIRRCNNVLRYIDSSGNIVDEPCIFGYSVKYANIYYNTTAQIPQGTVFVTVQNNSYTSTIQINDRFIFDKMPYKVKYVSSALRSKTFEKNSSPLIEIEIYLDAKAPDDDLELGIANMNRYSSIYPPITPEPKNGIIISPDSFSVFLGDTVIYSCYRYENDVQLANTFSFVPSGANTTLYEFNIIDENHFSVKSLGFDVNKLTILCSDSNGNRTIELSLRGVF